MWEILKSIAFILLSGSVILLVIIWEKRKNFSYLTEDYCYAKYAYDLGYEVRRIKHHGGEVWHSFDPESSPESEWKYKVTGISKRRLFFNLMLKNIRTRYED